MDWRDAGLRQKTWKASSNTGKVLLAVDQQAAGRLVEVLLAAHRGVLGGADKVQDVAGTHVQAQPPQHLGEQHQVVQQAGWSFFYVSARSGR